METSSTFKNNHNDNNNDCPSLVAVSETGTETESLSVQGTVKVAEYSLREPSVIGSNGDIVTTNAEEEETMTAPVETSLTPPPPKTRQYAMDLNVAYEALEQVRQANVAIEFGREVLSKECVPCLREQIKSQKAALQIRETDRKSRFNRFVAANKMANLRPAAPCLTCGTPVCPRHRCKELKRQNINICTDCSIFFSLETYLARVNRSEEGDEHVGGDNGDNGTNNSNNDSIVQETTTTTTTTTTTMEPSSNNAIAVVVENSDEKTKVLSYSDRKQKMNQMLDVYDRVLLVLQYSSRFIDDIATSLENNTKRNNQIGLGSSATGFVSGIAGVAAACTIFTPVGPPLLIASILFGGAGTAASAGSEAVNYHCSANKMCDTIIALHGMLHSIARLTISSPTPTPTPTTASKADEEETGTETSNDEILTGSSSNHSSMDRNTDSNISRDNPPPTTITASETSNASATTRNGHNRATSPKRRDESREASVRNWTRAAGNALKPLTFGALSAVSVVAEAREMRITLDKISAGNPCDKAETLREIGREFDDLPSTTMIAEACPKFFQL